jgi:anhydro-N-acetylmuramic acid kinase
LQRENYSKSAIWHLKNKIIAMIYRVIGLMSGSSLDGLDVAFIEFDESGGKWNYEIKAAACYPYDNYWIDQLKNAVHMVAYDYQLLHTAFGKHIGEQVNGFIEEYALHHQVQLIASHGHTTFHTPNLGMTAQLGDGAAIAAITGINVVSDLRAMDVAFGGQGAPIVPIGEKLLLGDYSLFLNLGGIANISVSKVDKHIAFDVCAANRVLNMLAQREGKEYDENGSIAARGSINTPLLTKLNGLDYYKQPYPKSLANSFGTDIVFPVIEAFNLSSADALRTYVEHIAMQVAYSCQQGSTNGEPMKMLVTGGGAFNGFLLKRLEQNLTALNIEVVVPGADLVQYKEALIMALIGILRWREEYNVISSVTGARRNSINGAVWIGQEA